MFLRIRKSFYRTSAWRLALRSTLVFATGSAIVFTAMYFLVATAVRARSDSWLIGESETLKQVALNTSKDKLYRRIVREVAELAAQELAYDAHGNHTDNSTVFFAQIDDLGNANVWVGPKENHNFLYAIQQPKLRGRSPISVSIDGWKTPFRVVSVSLPPGNGWICLGLLDSGAILLMNRLLVRFFLGWICMVGLGFVVTLLGQRRMLKRIDEITSAAASIRSDDLSTRVPTTPQHDEVARLGNAFNNMLDRIAASVNQLRTLTDSVAHDLKSPVTSVRGGLEVALLETDQDASRELVAKAIEDLDRLTDVITTSLDLAEADGGALRLRIDRVDLAELIHRMADLYAPSFAERNQSLQTVVANAIPVALDERLFSRMLSNLMENELHYAGNGTLVRLSAVTLDERILLTLEDDGPGFQSNLLQSIFQRFVKGSTSEGHGLGLAFVKAVVSAHGGQTRASNRPGGGAEIVIEIPCDACGYLQPDR
jgi:signal transduction histidine kinase